MKYKLEIQFHCLHMKYVLRRVPKRKAVYQPHLPSHIVNRLQGNKMSKMRVWA